LKGAALLIFIDGVGIGQRDPRRNACAWPGLRIFNRFLDAESPPGHGVRRAREKGWGEAERCLWKFGLARAGE